MDTEIDRCVEVTSSLSRERIVNIDAGINPEYLVRQKGRSLDRLALIEAIAMEKTKKRKVSGMFLVQACDFETGVSYRESEDGEGVINSLVNTGDLVIINSVPGVEEIDWKPKIYKLNSVGRFTKMKLKKGYVFETSKQWREESIVQK